MERDTRLHRANNNEEFVETVHGRKEGGSEGGIGVKGKRAFFDARSLMLSRVSPSSLFLARIVLWTTGRRRYLGWRKKKRKKKRSTRWREGKKKREKRETSRDGRRCCWWRCVVDGERNELQDGIAVGLSEKPSKEKGRGRIAGEKRAVWRSEKWKRATCARLFDAARLVGIVSLKSMTIVKSEKSERLDIMDPWILMQFFFTVCYVSRKIRENDRDEKFIENSERSYEKNRSIYNYIYINSSPFKNSSRKNPLDG